MTEHDFDIVARTLYGEARGEYSKVGIAAFIAVANVIANRTTHSKKYGVTYADVCLKPRQFSCWNASDPNRIIIQEETLDKEPLFRITKTVAQKVMFGLWPDLTKGSDHYHALSCKPYWAKENKIRLQLGNHIFYKLD